MSDQELPDYVAQNRVAWDRMASDYAAAGRREWGLEIPTWGIFGVPETELRLLPDDLASYRWIPEAVRRMLTTPPSAMRWVSKRSRSSRESGSVVCGAACRSQARQKGVPYSPR